MEERREMREVRVRTRDGKERGGEGTDEVWRRRRGIDEGGEELGGGGRHTDEGGKRGER